MPYKSEKMKLKNLQDRRRRLTDEQRQEIIEKYATGEYSWRSLAAEYGVNKGTIGGIVSETRQKSLHEYKVAHWRNYQKKGEEWNKVVREHRRYKQELYLKGELKEE